MRKSLNKAQLKNRKQVRIEADNFVGGVNMLVSATRLKKNEASEATNLMLVEDGIWTKRWGTADYGGVTFTNTIDGFKEYRKSDGTRELIVVADGKVWKVDPAASTKTEITGATFTQGTRCDFLQMKTYLYICNGTDPLALYDGTDLSTYSSIDTPAWDATPITRGAGLSAGDYTYYYRVSALNEVGETLAATAESITVNMDRDDWSAADEYVDLGWADVTGADMYVVYFADTAGYEVKLAEVIASEYRDVGTAVPNPYMEPMTADTSDGPKFSTLTVSGNRIWGVGDPSAEQRVYYSGTGANFGNFAVGYGGGWVDLEGGGRGQTTTVKDYQGDPHVFVKTDEGKGAIWKVYIGSVTIADSTFSVPIPEKLIPSKGTPAPRSVVHVENDVFFFNNSGVHMLGNEPGVLNVLRTNELSAKIRPYITGLTESRLGQVCAYYHQGKVFFSVPEEDADNSSIIYFDRERGAWVADWTIGVSQFGEFTDASDVSHLLGINGNKLVSFSANYGGDSGTAFTWKYVSPLFPVGDSWDQFAKIHTAYVRLRQAKGTIALTVTGTGRVGTTTAISSAEITQGTSDTGIGWDMVGTVLVGDTSGTPTLYLLESLIRYLNVDELIRELQWEISGSSINDEATITGIFAEGSLVKTSPPSEWRLS